VACTIEDVFVICSLKQSTVLPSEVTKQELLAKYVQETFELLVSKVKDANKEAGTFDKLGKKIVDNLKFQIRNIHVRFEEANPRHAYSFGLSLQSLTFGTTDHLWKPVFVEREKTKEEEPIFKLMNVENFKIYWQSLNRQSKEEQFLKLPGSTARQEAMRGFIANELHCFLKINCLVKMTINPASQHKLPLVELDISLDPINISFSKQKIVEVLDFTSACLRHNQLMLQTLLQKAIKKKDLEQEKKMRPLCASYVRSLLSKENKKGKKENKEEDYSAMLNSVPIESLYEWSMEPIKAKVQELREKELKKERTGWFSKTEASLSPEEVKELERLLNELAEDSIGGKGRPAECILLRLALKLKGIGFSFYDDDPGNRLKRVELKIEGISCYFEKSHNNSWFSMENRIRQIVADLQIEEGGSAKVIHLMENIRDAKREHLLEFIYRESVRVEQKSTRIAYHTDVGLGKTVFTYKKEYWNMFRAFFALPDIDQQLQNEAIGKLEQLRGQGSDSEEELQGEVTKAYNVLLSLESPSFILPLTASSCWYLDLGTINMKSESGPQHSCYPFKLRQLNMRYIDSKKDGLSSSLVVNHTSYFPIVKDINVDLKMTTSQADNLLSLEVQLEKIEISATRQ
jgi:hypothetical protein